jgi:hypothetical protein
MAFSNKSFLVQFFTIDDDVLFTLSGIWCQGFMDAQELALQAFDRQKLKRADIFKIEAKYDDPSDYLPRFKAR